MNAEAVNLKKTNRSSRSDSFSFDESEKPVYSNDYWYEDAAGYRKALRKAEAYQAPLIIYFRTDWCGFCLAVEKELLPKYAAKKAIKPFVKVKINPEHGEAENRIFKQMKGTGYPTFIVKPFNGSLTRVGVTPNKSDKSEKKYLSPENFVKNIEKYIPKKAEPAPINAKEHYARALQQYDQDKNTEALTSIKKAIAREPKKFKYYKLADDILVRTQDWDQIIKYWDKYIALVPHDDQAILERSGSKYHKGDIAAARKDAKKAMQRGNIEAQRFYQKLVNTKASL
ncbi:MAG: thioredoxin family protein [Pseudomonadales bacterium]|nr:thioredoxin family protein [Pseudomonadales bacterium]